MIISWPNSIDRIVSGVFYAGISDHHITFAFVPLSLLTKTIKHKFRYHSDQCIDELEISLIDNIVLSDHFNALWEEYGNCDQKFSMFLQEFYKMCDKCCPIRSKVLSIHRLRKPWLTPDIMAVIQRRHELYKKLRSGTNLYNSYRSICNEVSSRLRRAKQQYKSNKFEYMRNNIRSTWKLTNTILGKSKKSCTNISIKFGHVLINNESDVSKLFNTYFSQVRIELQQKFPQSGNPLSCFDANSRSSNSFRFFDGSTAEFQMLFSKFPNKGALLDKIPVKFYKKGSISNQVKKYQLKNYRRITTSPVLANFF